MADTTLPTLPATVDVQGAGAPPEGDPLEAMRAKAREHIESMEKNKALKDEEKLEFKTYVLEQLDENIKKFAEIDAQAAAKKAEEEAKKAAENTETGEEKVEDPFADIFKDDATKPDESTQEKQKIAATFIQDIKNYKETYLKARLREHEEQAVKSDESKLDDILGKLKEI